jgi:tetratricopeptide (TPR) repeat protein
MSKTLSSVLLFVVFVFVLYGCAGSQAANKERARVLRNLGGSLVQDGNLRAGLERLLEAAELDPNDSDIQHELALVYRDLGEYQLSLVHFSRALALRPKFPVAWNNKGTVYLKLRQWDEAIDCFQKASGDILYRTPHFAYNNLGLAYYGKGEYRKAIDSYQKALEVSPSYSPARTNLGLALERINRWEAAIVAYKRAIDATPNYTPAHFNLGRLYIKLNRYAEAAEQLEEIIKIEPKSRAAEQARELLKTIRQ